MSFNSGRVVGLPTDPQHNNSPPSSSPFHDCMESEDATWASCRAAAGLTAGSTGATSVAARGFETRGQLPFNWKGAIPDLGQLLGGSEQCYSVNNLGGTGWLTNTKVSSLKEMACTAAVNKAIGSGSGGLGVFSQGELGYYMGLLGPVVKPNVNLYLSIALMGAQLAGLNLDVTQLALDMCQKGIEHLIGDTGCTAPRRAGGKVEHTSVNGGAFDWALDGQQPAFDNTGVNCQNCVFSMILEASGMVDKDGITAVPEDTT